MKLKIDGDKATLYNDDGEIALRDLRVTESGSKYDRHRLLRHYAKGHAASGAEFIFDGIEIEHAPRTIKREVEFVECDKDHVISPFHIYAWEGVWVLWPGKVRAGERMGDIVNLTNRLYRVKQ